MDTYPPNLTETQLVHLTCQIKDYQLTHGSLLKLILHDTASSVPARPIGCSLFPTLFPRCAFLQAKSLACIFNKLYASISSDPQWLFGALQPLMEIDGFVKVLWGIQAEVEARGYVQDLEMGVFRGDYMIHCEEGEGFEEARLKQVEFNTFSVAGGTHGDIVGGLHRHLERCMYEFGAWGVGEAEVQRYETVRGIVGALARGVEAYGEGDGNEDDLKEVGSKRCVLMVVQPNNINICDERPIEYGLWDRGIPTYRVEFGSELLASTRVDESRKLLYTPQTGFRGRETEVAVVYWRAGYEASEYDDAGIECRRMAEGSKAIKCPSILTHLGTLKVVQKALTAPEQLSRFLDEEEVEAVRSACMDIFTLDDTTEGRNAREIATDISQAGDWVLKPNKEGGGNGVFGRDIPGFLSSVAEEEWGNYVLMRKIVPPEVRGMVMNWEGVYEGGVVSELGVFGGCIWRVKRGGDTGEDGEAKGKLEILMNGELGLSFKTKRADVDEMSVVKGYGCFDSPLLI